MKKISFNNADLNFNLKNVKTIKHFLSKVFEAEKKDWLSVNYIFCSDDYLIEINKQFLNHDYYTDIITFLNSPSQQPIESDIYISLDRIKENAKNYNVPYQSELLRVMIHGILHLCGYDDKTISQKNKMRLLEDKYLEVHKNVPREI